jgi:DNA-binding XRE family transcriptional regulator
MARKRGNPKDHQALARGTRQWRELQELEVADCANMLGITTRHMEYLESGQRRPSVDLMIKTAKVTPAGHCCAMGLEFCPQRKAQAGGGVSAPA